MDASGEQPNHASPLASLQEQVAPAAQPVLCTDPEHKQLQARVDDLTHSCVAANHLASMAMQANDCNLLQLERAMAEKTALEQRCQDLEKLLSLKSAGAQADFVHVKCPKVLIGKDLSQVNRASPLPSTGMIQVNSKGKTYEGMPTVYALPAASSKQLLVLIPLL